MQRNIKLIFFKIWAYAWPHTPKMIKSISTNHWSLSAVKKSISFFTFSLRYCKEIVNLSFWVLLTCLATHMQSTKPTSSPILFHSGDIAKICKLLIFGTLGMPGSHTQNDYHFVENFNVYLHAKNTLHHSLLSWDITL